MNTSVGIPSLNVYILIIVCKVIEKFSNNDYLEFPTTSNFLSSLLRVWDSGTTLTIVLSIYFLTEVTMRIDWLRTSFVWSLMFLKDAVIWREKVGKELDWCMLFKINLHNWKLLIFPLYCYFYLFFNLSFQSWSYKYKV